MIEMGQSAGEEGEEEDASCSGLANAKAADKLADAEVTEAELAEAEAAEAQIKEAYIRQRGSCSNIISYKEILKQVERLGLGKTTRMLAEFVECDEKFWALLDTNTQSFSPPIAQKLLACTDILPELRQEKVFKYDCERFDFCSLVAEAIGVLGKCELGDVHETTEGQLECLKNANYHNVFYQRWISFLKRPACQAKFARLLHEFVQEVVVPGMQAQGITGPVVYQKKPTLRVHLPSREPVGRAHRDAWYHHPCTEMNWWLPVTKAFGANTLHVESAPGVGDFHPLEADVGDIVRFWGNRCFHKTVANDSGRTRISFEVRVIPLSLFDPAFTDAAGGVGKFQVGGYYLRSDQPLSGAAFGASLEAHEEPLSLGDASDY
jgi:hypothetical protein